MKDFGPIPTLTIHLGSQDVKIVVRISSLLRWVHLLAQPANNVYSPLDRIRNEPSAIHVRPASTRPLTRQVRAILVIQESSLLQWVHR